MILLCGVAISKSVSVGMRGTLRCSELSAACQLVNGISKLLRMSGHIGQILGLSGFSSDIPALCSSLGFGCYVKAVC